MMLLPGEGEPCPRPTTTSAFRDGGATSSRLSPCSLPSPATVPHWPGLTEAVHWLIDDTGWDHYYETGHEIFNPDRAIGDILRDRNEVAAISAVLAPLLDVLGDLGPLRPDTEYLDHQRWPEVAAAARSACASLSTGT